MTLHSQIKNLQTYPLGGRTEPMCLELVGRILSTSTQAHTQNTLPCVGYSHICYTRGVSFCELKN